MYLLRLALAAVLPREGARLGAPGVGWVRQTLFEQPFGGSGSQRMSTVASQRNIPMLTISVAVVRKMLEAVAGSGPSFFNPSGINAPGSPPGNQPATMAR